MPCTPALLLCALVCTSVLWQLHSPAQPQHQWGHIIVDDVWTQERAQLKSCIAFYCFVHNSRPGNELPLLSFFSFSLCMCVTWMYSFLNWLLWGGGAYVSKESSVWKTGCWLSCVFMYQVKEETWAEKLPLLLWFPPRDASSQEHTHIYIYHCSRSHRHTHTDLLRLNRAQGVDGGLVCFPSDSLFMWLSYQWMAAFHSSDWHLMFCLCVHVYVSQRYPTASSEDSSFE